MKKKLISRSFSIVLVKYEKNHIYRMLRFNEIIYCVLFVIWIKKKREESFFVEISNKSTKRSIFESIKSSTKKQVLESNSMIILIFSSQFNQSTIAVSLFSIFSTERINTSSIESTSSISIFSILKRRFELRYRFDSFDFFNLWLWNAWKMSLIRSKLWNRDHTKKQWTIQVETND